MSELRPGGNRFAVVVAYVCLMLGLYVGAYYETVRRTQPEGGFDIGYRFEPTYLRGGKGWGTFFAPIHGIDRRMRPQFWVWNHKP